MISDKNALRVRFREIRKNAKAAFKDRAICDTFLDCDLYSEADTVFLYSAIGSEIDTERLISFSLLRGKRVALPKCLDKDGHMEFYEIYGNESLKTGAFSIREPDEALCKKAVCTEKSLCLVPGLAFDEEGYRLGYGKGYYDRFLSDFKGFSVGVCYDECLCENLPFNEYDITVDMIITDKKIIALRQEE